MARGVTTVVRAFTVTGATVTGITITTTGITVTGVAGKMVGRSPRLAGFFFVAKRGCCFGTLR
jgi:phosphate/sulfate permease